MTGSATRLAAAGMLLVLLPAPCLAESPPESSEVEAIRAVIQKLPDAWSRRDAAQFASAYTDPSDAVVIGGHLLTNLSRADNAKAHTRLWQTTFAEGSTITLEIVEIETLSPDVAVAVIKNRNDYVEGGQPKSLNSVITLTLVKTPEGWLIRQFNNNLVAPRPAAPKPPGGS